MTAEIALFTFLRAAVCGETLDENLFIACTSDFLAEIYAIASKHDLAHLLGHVMEKRDFPKCNALCKFKEAKAQSIFRYMRQDYEFKQISNTLNNANISHIPLKGAILRMYYPEPWMRTSADIDILVKKADLDMTISVLKNELNFVEKGKSNHDYTLLSPSGVNLELHFEMMDQRYTDERQKMLFANIWEAVFEENADYYMTDEMFYCYNAVHIAKHFVNGGCGIRAILDVWIMNHRMPHNREARDALLQKGGLLPFMKVIEQLAEAWFSGAEMDTLARQVGEYILRGGVYGNEENRAAFGQAKTGGKWRYLITRRVFMPYDYLKAEYPILKKRKWLTPVYQIVRWGRKLSAGKAKRYLREIYFNILTGNQMQKDTEKLLRQLELK